eukprot:scaffold96537_cov43-Prasinocladus_malaysianus.AAC.1
MIAGGDEEADDRLVLQADLELGAALLCCSFHALGVAHFDRCVLGLRVVSGGRKSKVIVDERTRETERATKLSYNTRTLTRTSSQRFSVRGERVKKVTRELLKARVRKTEAGLFSSTRLAMLYTLLASSAGVACSARAVRSGRAEASLLLSKCQLNRKSAAAGM